MLAFLLGLQVAVAGAAPIGAAGPAFSIDLASKRDYVAQTNFVQCVGASMQMMLNMIQDEDDRSAATQLELQKLARQLSGQRPDGSERQGASVRGWAAGLNLLGAGPYRLVGATTIDEALTTAAKAMRQTGRPVGLLMWRGRHAWVMSGFTSTKPMNEGGKVTSVTIYDPLYPYGSSIWGPSPKPGVPITVKALGRQFVKRQTNNTNVNNRFTTTLQQAYPTLSGKWVLVLPYAPHAPVRRPA